MTQKDRKTPPLTVLDVSRWQGRIDWDAVQRSGKIDGVMLRVLGSKNGKPYLDPMFEENYAACTSRGIPVGGYYYTCAVTPRQTAEELAALRAALEGKTFQYPLAIDVESAGLRVLAPEALAARRGRSRRPARSVEPLRHGLHLHEFRGHCPCDGRPHRLRPLARRLPRQMPHPPPRDVAVHQQRPGGGHRRPRGSERRHQGLPRDLHTHRPRHLPSGLSRAQTKGDFMNHKIAPATIARTAALALALTNQVLSATGHAMLPIESAQLEQLVSTGLTVAAALISWWKNNSFTPEAIEADDYFCKLKEHK